MSSILDERNALSAGHAPAAYAIAILVFFSSLQARLPSAPAALPFTSSIPDERSATSGGIAPAAAIAT